MMQNNDLISRSALLDSFDVANVTEYDESGCGYVYKAVPLETIKNAPAVDAEPVRHGRWEKRKNCLWRCSECGQIPPYDVIGDDVSYWECQYCPNCGAKMDGGADGD